MFGLMLKSTHEAAITYIHAQHEKARKFEAWDWGEALCQAGHEAIRAEVSAFLLERKMSGQFDIAAHELVQVINRAVEKIESDGREMAQLYKEEIKKNIANKPFVKIGKARSAALQKAKDKKAAAKPA